MAPREPTSQHSVQLSEEAYAALKRSAERAKRTLAGQAEFAIQMCDALDPLEAEALRALPRCEYLRFIPESSRPCSEEGMLTTLASKHGPTATDRDPAIICLSHWAELDRFMSPKGPLTQFGVPTSRPSKVFPVLPPRVSPEDLARRRW